MFNEKLKKEKKKKKKGKKKKEWGVMSKRGVRRKFPYISGN